uniref:Uncharacterized protein n=1 Tax=Glossina morsitans morsitans TaxID=37546 RepID=A0A1B0G6J0_GLOMM
MKYNKTKLDKTFLFFPNNNFFDIDTRLVNVKLLVTAGTPHSCHYGHTDYPVPAVCFREPTNEINNLHQKEKGDGKKMSIDEKKALYRANWVAIFMILFVYDEMPIQ